MLFVALVKIRKVCVCVFCVLCVCVFETEREFVRMRVLCVYGKKNREE